MARPKPWKRYWKSWLVLIPGLVTAASITEIAQSLGWDDITNTEAGAIAVLVAAAAVRFGPRNAPPKRQDLP